MAKIAKEPLKLNFGQRVPYIKKVYLIKSTNFTFVHTSTIITSSVIFLPLLIALTIKNKIISFIRSKAKSILKIHDFQALKYIFQFLFHCPPFQTQRRVLFTSITIRLLNDTLCNRDLYTFMITTHTFFIVD